MALAQAEIGADAWAIIGPGAGDVVRQATRTPDPHAHLVGVAGHRPSIEVDPVLRNADAWVVAGVSFYLGISFALAIGWISQRAIREGLVQISKAESFWATVIATGQYSSEEHSLLANEGQNGSSRPGGWFALLSFAAFSVGFFTLGCHAKTNTNTHENANAVHCPKPACRPSKVGG